MNYVTQSFDEFSRSLGPTDLALYAGAAIVLWVIFKDKLSPVQSLLTSLMGKLKGLVPAKVKNGSSDKELFFRLVESWKQTRDLAVESGCEQAVKVADEMFPYLSPNICGDKNKDSV